ncbi:hypothetical protein L596_000265 [Steinernema carpocapsae]|uniref:SKP1 component POZ domain-containing protein n=1 Tax=Steinernema carpocapsae TaxID=34508 RepID=A0A4U8ULV6_STECR|nr:hypothetical protein L596_000265 [Steinernema carpocapsae]
MDATFKVSSTDGQFFDVHLKYCDLSPTLASLAKNYTGSPIALELDSVEVGWFLEWVDFYTDRNSSSAASYPVSLKEYLHSDAFLRSPFDDDETAFLSQMQGGGISMKVGSYLGLPKMISRCMMYQMSASLATTQGRALAAPSNQPHPQ